MAKIQATWSRLLVSARLQRSSQCLAVINNQALVFGGEVVARQPVDNQIDVVKLSGTAAEAQTLDAVSDAPTPRVGSASAVIKDALYLFSGRGGLAMAPLEEHGTIWQYSLAKSAWSKIAPADTSAPFPAGRSYHAMASDGNDTLYVHAGCPESGRLADLWRYSVSARAWSQLPAAPGPARGGTSIAATADGKLYRMNGFDGKTEQGGALDVFDPKADAWETISFAPDGEAGPGPRSVSALVPVSIGGREHLVTMFGESDPSSLGHAGAGRMMGDVWAFDVQVREWSKVEPAAAGETPAPRGWFDADVTGDGKGIVVHGGLVEDNTRLGDVWMLNFA